MVRVRQEWCTPQRPLLSKALVVPAAIEKNSSSHVTPIIVEELENLRMLLRTSLSDFDLIVESMVDGVKEESRVRR